MASAALQYGRMIRPFPVKRLADATYYVMADANAIWRRVTSLMIDQPGTPETWWHETQMLLGELLSLRERIDELVPQITVMQDDADHQFDVAVRAMEAMLRGLQAQGEPPDGEREEAPAAAVA